MTCSKGLHDFLCAEIRLLGLPVISAGPSGVETSGTMEDAMRLNLFLRTGQRVLFLLTDFGAGNSTELYKKLYAVDWENVIDEHGYVSVTSSVDMPDIMDTRYANLKVKDAVVDRIRSATGVRPDSGPDKDSAVIHIFWKQNKCSVFLDTSGEPLSKRGYRKIPLKAPMQETLAAGVVMATGWNDDGSFINPMCGSGTMAIEAVLLGLNKAPGLSRDNFGFMHLKGYNETTWKNLRSEADAMARKKLDNRVIASDASRQAIETSMKNASAAGIAQHIEYKVCDYADTPVPPKTGIVLLNPEYGERMGDSKQLEGVYAGIGDFFKQKCKGYRGYIFTGNLSLARKVGLRTKRKMTFFNSRIECRLLEYELYEGSRKSKSPDDKNSSLYQERHS